MWLALGFTLAACGQETQSTSSPLASPDAADSGDLAGDVDAGGGDDGVDEIDADGAVRPIAWTVLVSPTAPEAVDWTADDVASYLQAMGLDASLTRREGEVTCEPGTGVVAFLGDGLGEPELTSDTPTDQTYRIAESRCGDGFLVALSGGGRLGRQYAGYEWLHALGVRFFHPEEEYVPLAPRWPAQPLIREHTPPFRFRSVSLHLTHPLALGDAFRLGLEEYFGEAQRYIDWQVKNLASNGHSGVGSGDLSDYGLRRGFPRGAGISLHNQQQGGRGVIDPDDPRSEEEQITEAIEARMDVDPEVRPVLFSFSFNPSEFTEVSDLDAVRQMTFIADYMAEHYPDVIVMTTNHGTGGAPTEHYGVRYFDLPQFAPPNLGVKVHTLMFYDLFRPAPVYGNETFRFLYDFMVSQYQTRRLWYFPEAAWWLTFDIPVPLYLPITIEARDRDIQAIAFMLEGKLDGHHVFGTGHEWGYWQNEYCSLRMAADLDYRYSDCLADITWPLGDAADEVAAVLERTIELQERDIIYGSILRYLVGTDPETEVAASVGIELHPLPPSPREMMGWDLSQVEDWERRIGPELRRMEGDYAELVERLDGVEGLVPEAGLPWFEEIRDGIEVTGLRAQHADRVYGAVVTLRLSQLLFDSTIRGFAKDLLEQALASTEAALEVIHRREAGYRYHPLERYIAGGPDGDEDENWTIYHYRELNRTHYAYYWRRIDRMAEAVFGGDGDAVRVADAVLGHEQALVVEVSDDLEDVVIDFGDGSEATQRSVEHLYPEPGVYELSVSGRRGEEPFSFTGELAQLSEKWHTGFSAQIIEPEGAELIEGVLPGIAFGPIDAERSVAGFTVVDGPSVGLGRWTELLADDGEARFGTQPERLVVPIVNRSTASIMTSVVVEAARFRWPGGEAPLEMTGDLSTQAVIDAIVSIGGFDEQGARRIVAATLGYSPETLPEQVPFLAEFEVLE